MDTRPLASGVAAFLRKRTGDWRSIMVVALLLGGMVVGGCDKPEAEARDQAEHKETLYMFGTLVEVTIRGVDQERAQRAVAEVEKDFQRMHQDWHAWKPGELTDLNAAFAAGESRVVSPFLLPLIFQAKAYQTSSGGLFNAAIGKIIATWGFHSDELPVGALPPLEQITQLAAAKPSMDNVIIEGDRVRSINPVVQLDLGGFAKGVALDRAMARLKELGVENAIINAGGGLATIGDAGARPWRIGIRNPVGWGVIASGDLEPGESMHTSGNYERYREHEGIRYAHIIDPRTGMSVQHVVSTTVIDRDGALADAGATALAVAGPEGWHAVAKSMGLKFALLMDDQGTVYANPAMLARIRFENGQPKRLVTSDPL